MYCSYDIRTMWFELKDGNYPPTNVVAAASIYSNGACSLCIILNAKNSGSR